MNWKWNSFKKKQLYCFIYINIPLAYVVMVHYEIFLNDHETESWTMKSMWVKDSFQRISNTKTKINNEAVRHVYIQSETFKNQTKSDK